MSLWLRMQLDGTSHALYPMSDVPEYPSDLKFLDFSDMSPFPTSLPSIFSMILWYIHGRDGPAMTNS